MVVAVDRNVVEFRFYRPQARKASVAGDFNNWDTEQSPMIRGADGYWRVSLRLGPGTYRFRYNVDGQWFADYAAFGVDHGPFGLDSIVRIA